MPGKTLAYFDSRPRSMPASGTHATRNALLSERLRAGLCVPAVKARDRISPATPDSRDLRRSVPLTLQAACLVRAAQTQAKARAPNAAFIPLSHLGLCRTRPKDFSVQAALRDS